MINRGFDLDKSLHSDSIINKNKYKFAKWNCVFTLLQVNNFDYPGSIRMTVVFIITIPQNLDICLT